MLHPSLRVAGKMGFSPAVGPPAIDLTDGDQNRYSPAISCAAAVIASDTAKEYVPCGGPAYWAIALSLIPLTAAVSAAAAVWLTRKYTLKAAAHRELPKGEVTDATRTCTL